jgi:hypothetical protein
MTTLFLKNGDSTAGDFKLEHHGAAAIIGSSSVLVYREASVGPPCYPCPGHFVASVLTRANFTRESALSRGPP